MLLKKHINEIKESPNKISSGQTREDSSMPDFLRVNGSALEFDILGSTVNLELLINNASTVFSENITKIGIIAAPSTNNTALINDATIVNDLYAGEDGSEIIIDTVGSEIISLVGQMVAFKTPTGEILRGYLKTETLITNVFRGYFFDSANNPVVRGNLSNDDTLTLMKLGWVFAESDGTTIDVSYTTPSRAFLAPTIPAMGDYWFDISVKAWKVYGTSWEVANRILVGQIVSDVVATIGSRCEDFSNYYEELNNIELDIYSSEIIKSKDMQGRINIYGTEIQIDHTFLGWNITIDLETGLTEAADTVYYLYISDEGRPVISEEKPYYREDLKGDYHPYHSWRLLGMVYNDSSSDFTVKWNEYGENYNQIVSPVSGSTTSTSPVAVSGQELNVLSRGGKYDIFFSNIEESDGNVNAYLRAYVNGVVTLGGTISLHVNGVLLSGKYFQNRNDHGGGKNY